MAAAMKCPFWVCVHASASARLPASPCERRAHAALALPAKNTLIAADAKLLEDAFEQKLALLSYSVANEASTRADAVATAVTVQEQVQESNGQSDQPKRVDKSLLTVAAPRRYRNREHLRFVARQACLVCGRKPSDPHHLRHL